MTLGEAITKYRSEHGNMSMREFARRSNLSVTYISSLEHDETQRGKKPSPTLDTYRRVASAMGIDIDELIRMVDDVVRFPYDVSDPDGKLTKDEQLVLDILRGLNVDGRTELTRYGKYLLAQPEYQRQDAEPVSEPTKIIPLFGNSFAAGPAEPDFGNMWENYEVPESSRAEFAIKINGDSMSPYLPDGSVALGVKRTPNIGEVGAFLLDGEFLCKQYCTDSRNVYLFSLNRESAEADRTLWSFEDHTLYCFGTILMDKSFPLPQEVK